MFWISSPWEFRNFREQKVEKKRSQKTFFEVWVHCNDNKEAWEGAWRWNVIEKEREQWSGESEKGWRQRWGNMFTVEENQGINLLEKRKKIKDGARLGSIQDDPKLGHWRCSVPWYDKILRITFLLYWYEYLENDESEELRRHQQCLMENRLGHWNLQKSILHLLLRSEEFHFQTKTNKKSHNTQSHILKSNKRRQKWSLHCN